jgi:hypothetical protein
VEAKVMRKAKTVLATLLVILCFGASACSPNFGKILTAAVVATGAYQDTIEALEKEKLIDPATAIKFTEISVEVNYTLAEVAKIAKNIRGVSGDDKIKLINRFIVVADAVNTRVERHLVEVKNPETVQRIRVTAIVVKSSLNALALALVNAK